MTDFVYQKCISVNCGATYGVEEVRVACQKCGDLLDVKYDWDRLQPPRTLPELQEKWSQRNNALSFSGVWRFHQLLPFAPPDKIVTVGEGQTLLQRADRVARYVGISPGNLYLQYEGLCWPNRRN